MKKTLVFVLVFLLISICFADRSHHWSPKQFNLAHTAPAASGNTIIYVDIDTIPLTFPLTDNTLYYSVNSQTSWSTSTASSFGGTDYPYGYSANVNNPASGDVYYYFHFETDSTWAGQSPFYTGSATTGIGDNYYMHCADDPTDDINDTLDYSEVSGHVDDLDITEYYFTMSNDKFYGKLVNNSGSWFRGSGSSVFTGWEVFGYIIAINNPDRADTTKFFAMAYTDNEDFTSLGSDVVLDIGILKIDQDESTIEVVASIDYNISGNVLEMSCDIADLLADPDFGPWPPPSGWVQVTASTNYLHIGSFGAGVFQEFTDMTKQGKYYVNNFSSPEPFMYTIGDNTAPTLSSPGYWVSASDHPHDIIINYTDADNNPPTIAQVSIDGAAPLDMTTITHSYDEAGTIFHVTPPYYLDDGIELAFTFSDGMATATYDYTIVGLKVAEEIGTPSEMAIIGNYPNPFNPSTTIQYTIPEESYIELSVYDNRGKLVENIENSYKAAGTHSVLFDMNNHPEFSSGLYFVKLSHNNESLVKQMLYIK